MVACAFAKPISKAKKAHPKGELLKINRPNDFGIEDGFYQTYFSKVDAGIKNEYQNRWKFHDQQNQYNPAFQRDEHYTIGSIESYGQGKRESQVRNEFAEQVLRMRIDTALRTYLSDKNGSVVKTAFETMDKMKDMRVQTSNSVTGGKAAELCFGYDVITDASKIEYIKGNIEAGIYHPKLTGAFSGRAQLADANFSVWTNMDGRVPRTSISLPMTANTFTTSLSQPLAKNVMGTLATSQPLVNKASNSTYGVSVAINF